MPFPQASFRQFGNFFLQAAFNLQRTFHLLNLEQIDLLSYPLPPINSITFVSLSKQIRWKGMQGSTCYIADVRGGQYSSQLPIKNLRKSHWHFVLPNTKLTLLAYLQFQSRLFTKNISLQLDIEHFQSTHRISIYFRQFFSIKTTMREVCCDLPV